MEVGDEVIEFNFHDAMKYPYNNIILSHVMNKLMSVCSKFLILIARTDLSVALSHDIDFTEIEEMEKNIYVPQNVQESALALQAL
jgi:hypothetical protein